MKKNISLTLLLSSLHAEATPFFVGLEQSYKKIDNRTVINGIKEKHDKSLNITSLKIGGINGTKKEGDRYELIYNLGDENVVSGLETVNVELHYNVTLPSLSTIDSLLPYVRFGASYVRVSEKSGKGGENPKYDAYGYILGVGTYYSLAENIDLSFGFDYGYQKWHDLTLYQGTVKLEAKDYIQKFHVGVNYLF